MKEILIKTPDGMELSLHELYERLYERIYEDTNVASTGMIVDIEASSFISMCEQVFALDKELKHKRMVARHASAKCKNYKKRYDRYKAELEKCNAELESNKERLSRCITERDAAIRDLNKYAVCEACADFYEDRDKCYKSKNCFVWRGVCEDNSNEVE